MQLTPVTEHQTQYVLKYPCLSNKSNSIVSVGNVPLSEQACIKNFTTNYHSVGMVPLSSSLIFYLRNKELLLKNVYS
jgi:hypothetical protein